MNEEWQEYTTEAIAALISRVDAIEDVLLKLHLAERRSNSDFYYTAAEVSPLLPDRPPLRAPRFE